MNHPKATRVDIVGVGINATDTIIRLPRFPAPDSKLEAISSEIAPGGQVASAIVACRRWGLTARYVAKIGDDSAGTLQQREMEREGVEAHWIVAPGVPSQSSFTLVNQSSGERTILWQRDSRIALRPEDLRRDFILNSKCLLVDGHDTEAGALAAKWAHEESIPVVGDFDNLYTGVQDLLRFVDFPVTSKAFPERFTGEKDPLKSLPAIQGEFKCRLIAATLGSQGVLAWDGKRFLQSPGLKVQAIDTTGAGDIFHGAFAYGLVQDWPIQETLEFCCAAAALNCTASGARGHIATLAEIAELQAHAERSEPAYSADCLREASLAALAAKVPS